MFAFLSFCFCLFYVRESGKRSRRSVSWRLLASSRWSLKYHINSISLLSFISVSLMKGYLDLNHRIISVSLCFTSLGSQLQGHLEVIYHLGFPLFLSRSRVISGFLCHFTLGSLAQGQSLEWRKISGWFLPVSAGLFQVTKILHICIFSQPGGGVWWSYW